MHWHPDALITSSMKEEVIREMMMKTAGDLVVEEQIIQGMDPSESPELTAATSFLTIFCCV